MMKKVNFLKTNTLESAYVLRPISYSTITNNDLVEKITRTSYVPKSAVAATLVALTEMMENYLMEGHRLQLDGFGTFSLTVDGNVAKTAQDAGIEKQFNKLKINFNPAVELKEKLANVDVELDGIWRCVDIEAENKVYERINQNHDGVELPDGDGEEDEAFCQTGLLVHRWQEMLCCNEECYDDLMRAKHDDGVAPHIRDDGQPANNAA